MEEMIVKTLEKLLKALEATGDFAIEQAPIIFKEFIHLVIAMAVIDIVVTLGLLAFTTWAINFMIKKTNNTAFNLPDAVTVSVMVVVSFISAVTFISQAGKVVSKTKLGVKALVAPRIFVIDEIRNRLGSKNVVPKK